MPNAGVVGTYTVLSKGTSYLHVRYCVRAPVLLRVHFVSTCELWPGYSERPNPHLLSNRRLQRPWTWERRQIAQSSAGDSQWDRSFDGFDGLDGLQSKPNPLATGYPVPSHAHPAQ